MENKQEYFQEEGLSQEGKNMLAVKEECKILLDRMSKIESFLKNGRVQNIPVFQGDNEFQEEVFFVWKMLVLIGKGIETSLQSAEAIVKHNYFHDKIGNFEGIVLPLVNRLEKSLAKGETISNDQNEIRIIRTKMGELYEYLKKLEQNPDFLKSEIGREWSLEEDKKAA